MQSLSTYLIENLHPIFERGSSNASKETMIQELMTCVFFDAYFNQNENFSKVEDIIEYYNKVKDSVITKLCVSGLKIKDFDEFLLETELKGRGNNKEERYTKKALDWQKSFLYQCESFDNWLKDHKSFPAKNLVFLHHDTSLGVRNGQVSSGWSLTDRVDKGVSKAGYSRKDDYQKADIYALTQKVADKPMDDLTQELLYWQQAVDGSTIPFVGISLKRLIKPLSHVHTYNMDKLTMEIDEKSVNLSLPIFDGVQFTKIDQPLKTGGTSAAFVFDATIGDDKSDFRLDIRTSAAGAESRLFNPGAKPNKNAYDCFSVMAGTQLNSTKSGGQLGRAQDLLKKWASETHTEYTGGININRSSKEGVWASSSTYNKRLQEIVSAIEKYHINGDTPKVSGAAAALIDWVADNADTILEMFTTYTKEAGKTSARGWHDVLTGYGEKLGIEINKDNYVEILTNIYEAVKWKSASWSILSILRVLFAKMNESGSTATLSQIAMFAKGITFDADKVHLPYVMIG